MWTEANKTSKCVVVCFRCGAEKRNRRSRKYLFYLFLLHSVSVSPIMSCTAGCARRLLMFSSISSQRQLKLFAIVLLLFAHGSFRTENFSTLLSDVSDVRLDRWKILFNCRPNFFRFSLGLVFRTDALPFFHTEIRAISLVRVGNNCRPNRWIE